MTSFQCNANILQRGNSIITPHGAILHPERHAWIDHFKTKTDGALEWLHQNVAQNLMEKHHRSNLANQNVHFLVSNGFKADAAIAYAHQLRLELMDAIEENECVISALERR
jgi:hypothetical protein